MRQVRDSNGQLDENDPRNAALCGARPTTSETDADAETLAGPEDESPESPVLSARQSRAVTLLAQGLSIREVAARLGLHRGTIFRWRQTYPAFGKELRRRTRVETAELASRMRGLLMKATQYAEIALETDGSKDVWSERVLRNRRIWALATSPAADEDELIDAPSDATRRDASFEKSSRNPLDPE